MIRDCGFTFNGIHSSRFNIYCNPSSRTLLPEKRRALISVPGRSGNYSQEDGAYNDRSEVFICTYTRQPGTDIHLQAREIAEWLSEKGRLYFDNEPDKYYNAYFTGAPPLAKHLSYGEFELTFTYSPPFAIGAEQAESKVITAAEDTITIRSRGTAPTPCRIIIVNRGTSTIANLRIEYKHI